MIARSHKRTPQLLQPLDGIGTLETAPSRSWTTGPLAMEFQA